MEIIHENEYVYKMNDEIEPYLATHRQEGYIPGAEDHLHRKDMGIVGKIHVQRYLAEKPKGVIIIRNNIGIEQNVSITYFIPDAKKNGGSYVVCSGVVKKVDEYEHTIIMTDQTVIPIEQIIDIKCEEW